MNKLVSWAVWDGNGALNGKDGVQKNTVYRTVCFPTALQGNIGDAAAAQSGKSGRRGES